MSRPTSSRSTLADALFGWPPPVLDPGGPYSASISTLAWVLIGLMTAVFLIVLAALAVALFGSPALKQKLGGERTILIGGLAFPTVVLTGLLVWGLTLTSHLAGPLTGAEQRVRVTGHMWWWRVAYLDSQGAIISHDANELHIPIGQPIVVELESADVVHSFWVPELAGKLDMVPGRRNLLRIQADRAGVYGGQCAEYCGGAHALMGFVVVAHEPAEYARWLAARTAPQTAQASGRGAALFQEAGCAACHRIAGTAAQGMAGPDLTHVASRHSLGAGILPNNRGTLTGWISNAQAIKHNNRMPAYTMLPPEDLAEIVTYLETRQ